NILPNHHDFLRELGIEDLSFPVYVSHHLLSALQRSDLAAEKRRAAALLLAGRRSEIGDDEAARIALAAVPLVECADEHFQVAAKVYFKSTIVSEVLGSTVSQAVLPEGHETVFSELYRWLGVADNPRFEDVVARIKTLVATPPAPAALASI